MIDNLADLEIFARIVTAGSLSAAGRELGLTPPKFYHLPLLLASDGRRLSKRDGDQSLENLREKYTPEEIIGKLAFACGLQASPAPTTPQALARTFDWSQVPKSDIVLPENLF